MEREENLKVLKESLNICELEDLEKKMTKMINQKESWFNDENIVKLRYAVYEYLGCYSKYTDILD